MSEPRKVLAISASGIGNTILFTPVLNSLRKHFSGATIDLLALSKAMADPVAGSPLVNGIHVLSLEPLKALPAVLALRREPYDVSIVAFPSNKWQFHVVSRLIGAPRRICHSYRVGRLRSLAFLENGEVPAVEGLHDVDQNLNLLKPLGIDPAKEERKVFFHLAPEHHEFAMRYVTSRNLSGRVLAAIHPGAGGHYKDWQGVLKRWPADRFAALCDRLIDERQAHVLILGGPEEQGLKEEVRRAIRKPEHTTLVGENLKHTAAILSRCRLMVSNDSGLMHVAAAVGVPTLGIFGPTNHTRTAPVGAKCRIIRKDLPCSPCLEYPFHSTSSKIRCDYAEQCLKDITVEEAFRAASEMMSA